MKSKQTPLFDACIETGGRMIRFLDRNIAIEFGGLEKEYQAIRSTCGLFDISQMGVLVLRGEGVKDKLQTLVGSDLNRIGPGESCQTILLNSAGGIRSSIIVHDRGQHKKTNEIILMITKDYAEIETDWISRELEPKGILIIDLRGTVAMLGLQGPLAEGYINKIIDEKNKIKITPSRHYDCNLNGIRDGSAAGTAALIARFSSEHHDSFQILLGLNEGIALWRYLVASGIVPCGLAIWNILRLEARKHIYGYDIDSNTSPLETSLSSLVHLEMPQYFMGRQAIEGQTAANVYYRLVGLKLESPIIPRQGCVVQKQGNLIGCVTRGGWSPSLDKPIALAYLHFKVSKISEYVEVNIDNKTYVSQVMGNPF
uniref:Putative Glycine cleavage T-protein (Aminomethyl transferase) n=1 Tax=Paulinella chromatophora TaxID=39717 RepID=B1X4F5_PAUCH|nr:putative Glycine cleavage T-protein (aminomethyl transferase) [Paulinella chromatophora]ACB42824.1 putative Glycine cleavage T-protein (aminomethyl transferase) [Paulinella chromatophora]